ncbi:MAG: glycosyltransferase [Bryobacteraceae bacterium]
MRETKPSEIGIVYFGNDWFGESRTSSHHIARLLSEKYSVLYVDVPGLRAPAGTARDIKKLFRKLMLSLQPPRRIGDRLWHTTVPQIPFRKYKLCRRLNSWFGRFAVCRAVRVIGPKRLISWFTVPHPHALAGQFEESLIVYYCVDDYASFPGMDEHSVKAMDEDLTRKADLVFAVSPPLAESKRLLNPNTVYSPHGVDAALFGKAADPETEVPELARGLKRPVIGFFGVIGPWIDIPLLVFLAKSRPDWTFLLVGFLNTDAGDLKRLPNVVFAGSQPYESLPGWAKAFDIGMIPTLRNRQRMNANPLKLREYLATGKPVVTVSTPATEAFAGAVCLADTPAEFLNGIERELAADSPEKQARRRASVAHATWEQRVREIDSIAMNALDRSAGEAAKPNICQNSEMFGFATDSPCRQFDGTNTTSTQ